MKVGRNYADQHVCLIGMGYVGLTLAVAMAEAGFRVHGVEIDPKTVATIKSGRAPFKEAGFDERLARQVQQGAITASEEWPGLGVCNVYIVTVGTPLSDGQKVANLSALQIVTKCLASRLMPGNMVILRSTVRVGVSRTVVKPMLDAAGVPYNLAFCPERTLEGKALHEIRTLPQIVGGIDSVSVSRAAHFFGHLTSSIVRVRSLETAEMVKLVNNTQRDLMFAFANEVAEICDSLGVSAPEVIESGNLGYPRGFMPMPGPVGGSCLEKDPYILSESNPNGVASLCTKARQVNEALPKQTARILATEIRSRIVPAAIKKGVIMGVAFKGRPETSDLRGSLAIPLISELKAQFPNAELFAFDPAVSDEEIRKLGVIPCASAEEAYRLANFVVYQNNNRAFSRLNIGKLSQLMRADGVIYDLWNQYLDDYAYVRSDIAYFGLGTQLLARKRGPVLDRVPTII